LIAPSLVLVDMGLVEGRVQTAEDTVSILTGFSLSGFNLGGSSKIAGGPGKILDRSANASWHAFPCACVADFIHLFSRSILDPCVGFPGNFVLLKLRFSL
jgi:hypothetical protein